MRGSFDHRVWITTDRPGERIAIGEPLEGALVFSGRDSDRAWSEYHTNYKLCLVNTTKRGVAATIRCRGVHHVAGGELMAFEPGDHHVTTAVSGKGDFDVVSIEPSVLEQAAAEMGYRGTFHFRTAALQRPATAAALSTFVTSSAGRADALELECRYTDLVRSVIDCGASPVSLAKLDVIRHYGVRIARDAIRDEPGARHHLEDLAKLAGLSRFAFSHAFKQWLGCSPFQYLKLCRAFAALRMIEQGKTLEQVVGELGYTDEALLCRTIKSFRGVPPGRWRRCLHVNSLRRTAPGDGPTAPVSHHG